MDKTTDIKLFENRKVRSVWDAEGEKWYISIVDVIGILTDSPDPRNYWKVLKNRLVNEGNETVTNCNQLKLLAADGKMRLMKYYHRKGYSANWINQRLKSIEVRKPILILCKNHQTLSFIHPHSAIFTKNLRTFALCQISPY